MMTRLRYWPTAWALGGFLAVSYVVCVAWDGLFPSWAMREAWQGLLPGFVWLSPGSFLLGLAETVLYGFWLALIVPVVSWAHGRARVAPADTPRPARAARHPGQPVGRR